MAIIRKGKLKDVEHIVQLWKELADHHKDFEKGYSEFVPELDEIQIKFFERNVRSRKAILLVAEDEENEGQLVGYLTGSIATRPPVFVIPKHGFIGDLVVSKSHRNQGIGKALVKEFESWAKEKEMKFVTLAVFSGNDSGMEFWETVGYKDTTTVLKRRFI